MFTLPEPIDNKKISHAVLGYCATDLRLKLYDLILKAFLEKGLTKQELASRLGKDPAQISRLLSGPGNWTVDTAAHLLYGICGNLIVVNSTDPRSECQHNDTAPSWLHDIIDYQHKSGTFAQKVTAQKSKSTAASSVGPFVEAVEYTQIIEVAD